LFLFFFWYCRIAHPFFFTAIDFRIHQAKMQEYITGRVKLSDCDSNKAIKGMVLLVFLR